MNKNVPKLRFKGFEDEWKSVSLGELFIFKNGLNKEKEFFGKGTPIVNYTDVYRKNELTSKNILGLVEVNDKEKDNYSVRKGDVFFTRTSETIEEIGFTAVVTEAVRDTVFSGFVLRARPINNLLNVYFCKYCFSTFSARKEIITKSSYTTRALTSGSLLKGMNIYIPSLQEQEKIANLLTKVDNLIEEQDGKVSDLEQYKKGVMQKIFSQEIRFKDENGCDYPEWEKKELREILIEDLYPVEKPKKPYLKLSVRSHAKGTFTTLVEKPEEVMMDTLYEVKPNQLIVNITFAWEHAIAIIKNSDENKLVSHRFPTYKFDINSYYKFYEYVIKQKRMKYDLSLASPGGAGRNRVLNKKEFLQIEVVHPCIAEQKKIADFLSNIDNIIEEEKSKLEDLKKWKKGLLQQMFV